MQTNKEQNQSELREQLEEFALHIKPGTTKGKHRTGIFDTYELAKLVKALIHQAEVDARIDEAKRMKAFVTSTAVFDENETQHDRRLEFLLKRIAELERGSDDTFQTRTIKRNQ